MNDKADNSQGPPAVWIVRACQALHVPLWLGVLILGLLPFPVMLFVGAKVAGLSDSLLSGFVVPEAPLTLSLVLVPILCTIYLSRTAEHANNYAETLLTSPRNENARTPINFESLYSMRFVAPIAALIYIAVFALYYEFGTVPIPVVFARAPSVLYAFLVIGAEIWVYAYSMYSIRKVGSLPLTLKSFTEDRTLGLRPFGTASLKFTVAYVLSVCAAALSGQSLPLSVLLGVLASFSLLGMGFFFLPLLSLHRKLATVKREHMDWISTEHGAVLNEMQLPGGLRDGVLATRLATVKSVRQDLNSIHVWPFDTSILVRVVSITVLPILLTVFGREVILLVLGL